MSVWYCIPSARPPEEAEPCLAAWRKQGYRIGLYVDGRSNVIDATGERGTDLLIESIVYPGYARAVNMLVRNVAERDPQADWIVTGGDDVWPDQNHTAEQIARQCSDHFGGIDGQVIGVGGAMTERARWYRTFGVMQPTGDRFSGGSIDRICGSPWMGREFCKRIYGGQGPLWPEFTHMFVDEHLQAVAIKLGILWQRSDLIHLHRHYQRAADDVNSVAVARQAPPHLAGVATQEHWIKSKAIFERLKAGGFSEADDLLPARHA